MALSLTDPGFDLVMEVAVRQKHTTIGVQVTHHEGLKLKPYKCSAGKLTIGIGRNLDDKGISEAEAVHLFHHDMAEVLQDLMSIFGVKEWLSWAEGRRWAMIDLRFNIGPSRFRGFKKMVAAAKVGDWANAALELKDSKWWGQIQADRRDTLYDQLLTGEP